MPKSKGVDPTRSPSSVTALSAVTNLAIWVTWIALHTQPLRWLVARFSDAPLHVGVLLGAAGLLLIRLRFRASLGQVRGAATRPPRLSPVPLALVVASALALVVAEHRLGPSTLSALLLGLGAYGLIGLYTGPDRFFRALPGALLLIALLPFGEQADTYFGFTARVGTAHVVSRMLAVLGHSAVPVETILVLENGIAHIDVACSGARGLFTGALFFLVATLMLGRRPGLRWALAGVTHVAFLLAENVARIATIVILAVGLRLPRVGEVFHVPLGVLGFVAACATTVGVLRYFVPATAAISSTALPADPLTEPGQSLRGRADRSLAWMLIPLFATLALVPRQPVVPVQRPPGRLELASMFETDPLPLTEAEADLFRRWGGSADKRAFRSNAGMGTLLAVFSRSWRAHHAPEICLASSGVRIEGLHEVTLEQGSTVRVAAVDGGRRTAIYWFQSPDTTTADLATRIWSDVSGREHRWVQLSMIVDAPLTLDTREGRALVHAIQAAIARFLAEESA